MMITGVIDIAVTGTIGFLTDRNLPRSVTIVTGLILTTLSCMFLDTRNILPSFSMSCVMFTLLEISAGVVQVSILPLLIQHHGGSDVTMATEHMTMIYNIGYFGGSFLGPVIGGVVLSYCSYLWSFRAAGVAVGLVLVGVIQQQWFGGTHNLLTPQDL